MRQSYLLKASLIGAIFLAACAEAPQNSSEGLTVADASTASSDAAPQDKGALNTAADKSSEIQSKSKIDPTIPKRYQGLDLNEITQAEINELVALEKEQVDLNSKQSQRREDHRKAFMSWRAEDPATRGPGPQFIRSPREEEIRKRLIELREKLQLAGIRKQYENLDTNILSKAEVEELITLQREQVKSYAAQRKLRRDGINLDSPTRGEHGYSITEINPRLQELQGKVQSAKNIKRLKERMEKLSVTHNVTLLDSEIAELIALEAESLQAQKQMTNSIQEAMKSGQIQMGDFSEESIVKLIPRHDLHRMIRVEQRMKAIKAPLIAAEKTERVRNQLKKLSERSGVVILSSEIDEAISLNAEKDRIKEKAEKDAAEKWINEGGPIPSGKGTPTPEDVARFREIDIRLKEISAPMKDALAAKRKAKPLTSPQRNDELLIDTENR